MIRFKLPLILHLKNIPYSEKFLKFTLFEMKINLEVY
jgi:hypothetical protein